MTRNVRIVAVKCIALCALLSLMMGCPPISNPIEQDVAKKTNADLRALTLSSGTLSPTFAAGITAYTATVGSGVTSIAVTATKAATGAKIEVRVNGGGWGEIPSGGPSSALALNVGANTIEVRVTAEDGKSTKAYTISVYRLSAAALLSALSTSAGTLSPAFDANTVSYAVSVANTVSAITVTATVAQTGATIQVQVSGGGWQAVTSGSVSPSLSLNVGDNPVEVKVTADDGQTTNTYSVTVHRISTNADLSALEPSSGTLTPSFSASLTSYTLSVGGSSLTVRPTAADAHSSIQARVNGGGWLAVSSGSDSGALSLNVGNNTVEVQVTAEDGVTTKSYSIGVYRQSDNAELSALTISPGSLTPSFSAATTSYTVIVANGVTSVTVTPTVAETHASIQVRVNGGSWQTVASGSASGALSLSVGDNTVETRVTAENGSTKTYSISVHDISSSADLSALTVSSGTLTPAFSPATMSYVLSVANGVASVTVTPTAATAVSSIQVRVNGGSWQTVASGSASGALSLNVGDNTMEVKVVSMNGQTTKTYTVGVHRISSNADLSALTVSSGSLSPAFSASSISYSLTVGESSITVRPTAADTRASIRVQVNGGGWQTVVSGSDSTALSLSVGANTVVVEVSAEDGVTKKSYTIGTYRQSDNADLNALTISAGAFSPAFSPATTSYAVSVVNGVASVTVTPTAAETHASIQVRVNGGSWQTVASGSASGALNPHIGVNIIEVQVTAMYGNAKTYTITYATSYPTYTVSYNGNNATSGTAPVDSIGYISGQTVTVLGYGSLLKTGYYFIGWNTAADGSGTRRRVGSPFAMGSANVTLYAQWLGDLVASDGATGDGFGYSVAASGDGSTLVISAPGKTIGSKSGQGAAYVFIKSGSSWSQATLTASDGAAYDEFGTVVAASSDGSALVIGAPYKTIGSNDSQGAAYVFTKSGSTWSQAQILTASDGAAGDQFGFSVAASSDGSTLAIGAPYKTIGSKDSQGAAYVFTKSESTWSQAPKLTTSDGAAYDYFGSGVAASSDGSTLVIGAYNKTIGSNGSQGAAYVFTKSESTWSQAPRLTASDGAGGDYFSYSVAAASDGSALVIGTPYKTIGSNTRQGAAYVFTNSGSSWSQAQCLTASDGAANDYFGTSVAASSDGSTLVIGAYYKTIGSNSSQGAAYVFAKSVSTWSQAQCLTASDGEANDYFGVSVAASSDGSTLVIGAPYKTIGSNSHQGAAYVF